MQSVVKQQIQRSRSTPPRKNPLKEVGLSVDYVVHGFSATAEFPIFHGVRENWFLDVSGADFRLICFISNAKIAQNFSVILAQSSRDQFSCMCN